MGGREEESVGGAKSAGVAANGPPDQRTSTNKPQPTMLKKKIGEFKFVPMCVKEICC